MNAVHELNAVRAGGKGFGVVAAGGKVRVTTQLMNAEDGFQLWSERFDRDLNDIFAIQDEIARSIVERLELTLGLKEAKSLVAKPTDDLEAYELYLRGREAVQQRTPPSMRRALGFFEQAVGRDPSFARAHLGIAEAYVGLGVYDAIPPLEARSNAEEAIAKAEALDPGLRGVTLLRGQLKLYLRPDWPTSLDDFAEVLHVEPNSALAHAYTALALGCLRQCEPSRASITRAVECDPLSPLIRGLGGLGHYLCGRYEDVVAICDEGLALHPASVLCVWSSALALERLGRLNEALGRFRNAVQLSRRGTLMVAFEARVLMRLGRADEAQALVEELKTRAAKEYVGAAVWLEPVLVAGSDEEKEEMLQLNVAAGTGPTTVGTSLDVELEGLLSHPRLGGLVRQLSLYEENPRFSRTE